MNAETELIALRSMCRAAAAEIQKHYDAHCDAEGYGPCNLMSRLTGRLPPALYPNHASHEECVTFDKGIHFDASLREKSQSNSDTTAKSTVPYVAQITLPTGATITVGYQTGPDGYCAFKHIMETDQDDGRRTRLEFSLSYPAAFALVQIYAAFGMPTEPQTQPEKKDGES